MPCLLLCFLHLVYTLWLVFLCEVGGRDGLACTLMSCKLCAFLSPSHAMSTLMCLCTKWLPSLLLLLLLPLLSTLHDEPLPLSTWLFPLCPLSTSATSSLVHPTTHCPVTHMLRISWTPLCDFQCLMYFCEESMVWSASHVMFNTVALFIAAFKFEQSESYWMYVFIILPMGSSFAWCFFFLFFFFFFFHFHLCITLFSPTIDHA